MLLNTQLYRTNPKLTGNMQFDLILASKSGELQVDDFHLSQVVDRGYVVDESEYLLQGPIQLSIKNFYNTTKSTFYDYKNTGLESDWPLNHPHQGPFRTWDDDLWAGTKRSRRYGRPFETLIPVWVEACRGINIYITIKVPNADTILVEKKLSLVPTDQQHTFHDRFIYRLFEYFQHCGIYSPEGSKFTDHKYIDMNLERNECTVTGLDVRSGNMVTRRDLSTPLSLIYRERPLVESNSILTNLYNNYHLITPQYINFNLIYDPEEWVESLSDLVKDAPNFEVSTRVEMLYGNHSHFTELKKQDIYTNHYYVPRPRVDAGEWSPVPGLNALDYLRDYTITDLMHYNKITQPICHWAAINNASMLYNLYDGFGSYFEYEEDGVRKTYIYKHVYGSAQDASNTTYDRKAKNHNWTGKMKYGDGKDVDDILSDPEKYIYKEKFLHSTSTFLNGMSFNFTSDDVDDIYVGLMASPIGESTHTNYPSTSYQLTDDSQETIAIWWERWEEHGRSMPVQGEYPNSESKSIYKDYDQKHDVERFRDMDGRYNELLGLEPINRARFHDNVQGLFVCMRHCVIKDEDGNDKKILAVILWTNQHELEDSMKEVINSPLYPEALVMGNVIAALKNYTTYYKGKFDELEKAGKEVPSIYKKQFDHLSLVNDTFQSIKSPSAIYFDRSILLQADHTMGPDSLETVAYKMEGSNSYVYRHSASLRPAIFDTAVKTEGNVILYNNGFGRNYLWEKYYKEEMQEGINRWDYTGVPPKYPSIGYDSYHTTTETKYGDLIYTQPHSRIVTEPEFKWFDRSRITLFNKTHTLTIKTSSNDKETLWKEAIDELHRKINVPMVQPHHLEKVYNIRFELQKVDTTQNSIFYIYKVIFTRYA